MKKNLLKLAVYAVGAVFIASSCLKTEELESVKSIREANASKINAETEAILLQNWYDSSNYVLNLSYNEAQNNYNISQFQYNEMMLRISYQKDSADEANARLLAKAQNDYNIAIQNAKTTNDVALANATLAAQVAQQQYLQAQSEYNEQQQRDLLSRQILIGQGNLISERTTIAQRQSAYYLQLMTTQNDSIKKANSSLINLYSDYNKYYSSGTNLTLSTGVVLSKGIFAFEADLLTAKNNLLNWQDLQANDVEAEANLILSHRNNIRLDSVTIVDNNRIIGLYENAKTTSNYDNVMTSINQMLQTAETEYITRQAAYLQLIHPTEIAENEDTAATNTYNRNSVEKGAYQTKYLAELATAGCTSEKELTIKLDTLLRKVSNTKAVYDIWTSELNSVSQKLSTANTTTMTRQNDYNTVCATLLAKRNNDINPSPTELADSTSKRLLYYAAQKESDSIKSNYDKTEAKYLTSLTNYTNAVNTYNTNSTYKTNYDSYRAVYVADSAKDATLKTNMITKKDAYKTASAALNSALGSYNNAAQSYNNYLNAKNTLASFTNNPDGTDPNQILISGLTDAIANLENSNTTLENDIADYLLQINRINEDDYKIDDMITRYTNEIDYLEGVITDYQDKADAIKTQIDAL
jgi:hypothetical protein